jgi:hypothetical protein
MLQANANNSHQRSKGAITIGNKVDKSNNKKLIHKNKVAKSQLHKKLNIRSN